MPSGPNVARSATGELLAQGPPGADGADGAAGPTGPMGPAGAQGTVLAQQSVSGAGTINANLNSRVWTDASGGTCTVNAPALTMNAQWGVCDWKSSGSPGPTFTASHYASIPNPSSNIEDPNNPGVYTTNPIEMQQPSQSAVWECDPSRAYWKLVI